MKFDVKTTENVFTYARALDQEGRQKNIIFCFGNVIYILNDDRTIILKFPSTQEFKTPVIFYANDYDSEEFEVRGDKIVFILRDGKFVREVFCRVPGMAFEDAEGLFNKFWDTELLGKSTMIFEKTSLSLLDENLSHIEFAVKDKEIIILQRDIYTGKLIKLKRMRVGMNLHQDAFLQDFGPLGMRTNDFKALFSYDETIKIHFLPNEKKYFFVEGSVSSYGMKGVVGGCLYDDLGTIYEFDEAPSMEETEGVDIKNRKC